MSRLIDADALRNVFEDMANDRFNKSTATSWGRVFEESADIVDEQPTIEERKRGEWIEEPNCWYRCSNCGKHYPSMRGYMDHNFCPNCGADMRTKETDRDYERAVEQLEVDGYKRITDDLVVIPAEEGER